MDTYFTVFKAQGEALLTAIHNMIKAVVSAPEVIEDLDDVDKNHVRAFFNNLFNTTKKNDEAFDPSTLNKKRHDFYAIIGVKLARLKIKYDADVGAAAAKRATGPGRVSVLRRCVHVCAHLAAPRHRIRPGVRGARPLDARRGCTPMLPPRPRPNPMPRWQATTRAACCAWKTTRPTCC